MPRKKVNKQNARLPSNRALVLLFVSIALFTHVSISLHEHSQLAYWVSHTKPIFSRFKVKSVIANDQKERKDQSVRILSDDPMIRVYPHFITAKESKQLIALAKSRLEASKVMRGNQAVLDDKIRSSKTAYLSRSDSHIVAAIEDRICKIVACEVHQIEPLQVVHYSKGQFYKPHHDYLEPGDFEPTLGQRLHTFLIYLNNVAPSDGGLTFFPQLNISIQPEMGAALYFRNLDIHGNPDPRTLHAGEEIFNPQIEKWAINVWIREKTFSKPE
ncbi:MAG: 2OG-Fe(II) oxygenase [Gammaproteobacteria bacterium]|nr:2OG-Fe(II) oxygenase [Gammaproteobacteria bacterium]MBP9729266.1 2OG-Fe(II) oxygenase [Gammaproteobacteria bacterium]